MCFCVDNYRFSGASVHYDFNSFQEYLNCTLRENILEIEWWRKLSREAVAVGMVHAILNYYL